LSSTDIGTPFSGYRGGTLAGTVFIQGYIYSEPVEQVYWRAPAAALIVALFVAFWCSLDYKSPGVTDHSSTWHLHGRYAL